MRCVAGQREGAFVGEKQQLWRRQELERRGGGYRERGEQGANVRELQEEEGAMKGGTVVQGRNCEGNTDF